ncbi:metallophosphoesterase [Aneurinibacillus terranovensis]|uniref:metallophosphoesterase n=1 Tax=Aneurinibacillus terranovensis TaxID=278991 RepID=UPI0004023AB5|nr:metallophosphoesterase [Aneurinibacillus terranovensis]
MKILVVSDTHGSTEHLPGILQRHRPDYVFHCGDFCYSRKSFSDFSYVRGNCDIDSQVPDENITDIGSIRIFQTHGHLYRVKETVMRLKYRALEANASLVLFGHTHVPACVQENGILYVNPGSLLLPRRYPVPTYALIEWPEECPEEKNGETVEMTVVFYSETGEKQQRLGGVYSVRALSA